MSMLEFSGRSPRFAAPAGLVLLSLTLATLPGGPAWAQAAGNRFSAQEPELASLFDAAYTAQARVFGEIAAIGSSDETRTARDAFERNLRMRARMSMAEMMAMMSMQSGMTMPGPYDERESAISAGLLQSLRERQSPAAIRGAYDSSGLPEAAVDLIRAGRRFEVGVYEILADNSVGDKQAALSDSVAAYLSRESSVPAQPKPASVLLEHPYAGAFASGFPKLSRTLWSTQWLQLATIEAMLLAQRDSQYWGSIDTVRARFDDMVANSSLSGSLMPVELPMAPAIAPTLFTLSPDAAVILDNLNMFETVVADVLSWPNLDDSNAIIEDLVAEFTNHDEGFDTTLDYLVSALRGGIFNQGGPAVGELNASERNRSRSQMGMQHAMVMSTQ
jgi:hypothetical protein